MNMISLGGLATLALCAAAMTQLAQGAETDAAAASYAVPKNTPTYVRKAVESSARSDEHKARDSNRKPAELLALSGVKPGDNVIEFAAFGQYFTTLLSDIVGPNGKIHMYDLPYTEKRAGEASRAFVAAHPNSIYEIVNYNELKLPQQVDVVFNVLYYHDLSLNDIDVASLNKRIFDALKPGGVFFIVDHNATAGSGRHDAKALHRIDPALIKQEVTAAGFELVEESNLLARSDDDHTKMVFTPGARGLTDQSVFKFRKPTKK